MRMRRIIKVFTIRGLFFCVLIIQTGCSLVPRFNRPALPTAECFPRNPCEGECTNICEIYWEDFFADPRLQELIKLGLENNRDLRVTIARMEEAIGIFETQFANLFPTVNADAAMFKMRVPGNILPNTRPFIFSAYLTALTVISWELDLWGRLRSLKDAALENFVANEETTRATMISLIGQIANSYLMEVELNELVRIAKDTVETRQKYYRMMSRKFNEGSSSKFDFIQAESLLEQAESDLTSLQRRRELNWNALTLLVGVPIEADCTLLSEVEPYFTKIICPGLPSELLFNRPDIRSAEHKLRAENANIGAARAAFFPSLTLTGAYGSASPELDHLFGHAHKFWAFFPNITMPLFDWGRNRGFLDLAVARKNAAISQYEKTIQVAFREVADAIAEHTWLREQIEIQRKLVDAQTERARLAWIGYEHGSLPYFEVLDAERDKFAAQESFVQLRRSFLASEVNLYIALGGGDCREDC